MSTQAVQGKDANRRRRAVQRRAGVDERTTGSVPMVSSPAFRQAASPDNVLAIQRVVGNAATATRLRKPAPVATRTIRRHSSWEHAPRGDTPPKQLGEATVPGETRSHVLVQKRKRVLAFNQDPGADPRVASRGALGAAQGVQTLGLVWRTQRANRLPARRSTAWRAEMVPVLRRMRIAILAGIRNLTNFPGRSMTGAAKPGSIWCRGWKRRPRFRRSTTRPPGSAPSATTGCWRVTPATSRPSIGTAGRSSTTRRATKREGITSAKPGVKPLKDVGAEADDHLRQALLNNGYGDHFLQDSFAAGHLVNSQARR